MNTELKYLSITEAGDFLFAAFAECSRDSWCNYIKHNPSRYHEQDGLRIPYHLHFGEVCYTKEALQDFVSTIKRKRNSNKKVKSTCHVGKKIKYNPRDYSPSINANL